MMPITTTLRAQKLKQVLADGYGMTSIMTSTVPLPVSLCLENADLKLARKQIRA